MVGQTSKPPAPRQTIHAPGLPTGESTNSTKPMRAHSRKMLDTQTCSVAVNPTVAYGACACGGSIRCTGSIKIGSRTYGTGECASQLWGGEKGGGGGGAQAGSMGTCTNPAACPASTGMFAPPQQLVAIHVPRLPHRRQLLLPERPPAVWCGP